MILSPEIHPHKTKIQFQDDSAAANSSAENKKRKLKPVLSRFQLSFFFAPVDKQCC